jgi:SAM-dependent methyltransferase
LSQLGLDPSVGSRFETVSFNKLKYCLSYGKELGFDSFVDIGCGLDRALIVAYELEFQKLYGLDISESLINACSENLKASGIEASLICNDVDNFQIPNGKILIYLFNPFGEKKMANLVKKLESRKYESLIVYHTPKYSCCFKPETQIKQMVWKHFGLYDEVINFYLIPPNIY